jgi:DMSO/TMAO reductase YedYZ molybdopterin-dependent catalytic subunit
MSIIDPIKRVARLRNAQPSRPPDVGDRLPPGQYLTTKFPVLTYGPTPLVDSATWRLTVRGLVKNPITLAWDEFVKLPTRSVKVDIHCVTRWSLLDTEWEGVSFAEIERLVEPLPEARFVMQHAAGEYTTNVPLSVLRDDDVLLAYRFGGEPLPAEHGGPARMLVPKLYFWKSAKWLTGLEFLPADRPGFWEMYGYHNHGNPWREERFG